MARNYIPVYFDLLDEACSLTDQEFGRMVRAAIMYARGIQEYMNNIQGNERFVLPFLLGQIDRNNAISVARAKAGANKKEQKETNDNKTKEKETKSEKPEKKKFVPPAIDEVALYCVERNNHVNAEKFVDYYSSNGWKVGKNPMKDWKAAVRTWERSDLTEKDYQHEREFSGLPY